MPAIKEYAQVIVEHYDYDQSAWMEDAELGDDKIISAGIRKQCCPDGAIAIGGVYAALLSITCRMPGMSYFHVRSARLTVKHKYNSELNYTQLGVFYVTDCKRLAGDLFQISAQDAVGWTDTSSRNYHAQLGDDYYGLNSECGVGAYVRRSQELHGASSDGINGEIDRIVGLINKFVENQCGIGSMLQYEYYDVGGNANYYHCNQEVPNIDAPDIYNINVYDYNNRSLLHNAVFPLYTSDGSDKGLQGYARSDSPRDFLRFLAELACGFIHATDDGKITLGQFAQPKYGIGSSTAEISTSEIETDSCEIADYTIKQIRTQMALETQYNWSWPDMWDTNVQYDKYSYIRYLVESNPYANGFFYSWQIASTPSYDAGFLNRGLKNSIRQYAGGYTIRPFRATVHKEARYHLGQRIKIHFKAYGESTESDYESIITSIQWNFRGGWKIACGGEDGRSMFDCVRATKGDRVARDLRNSITALRDQS